MFSEAIFKIVPVKGNARTGQRDSGYSVVSNELCASRRRTGELQWPIGTRIQVNCMALGVCEPALKPKTLWKDLCLKNFTVRAETKTGLGKSDRPGLQGGLRKRGLW